MTLRQTLGRYSAAYLIRNGVPRQIDIRDADGESVLGSAPALPVAPTFTSPATISPASGPAGTVFTLGLGAASGTAPVALSGVLLLDGVSVTDQITGGQYTSTVAGTLTWVVTASNGTAPNATSSASATVTVAQTAPVVTADPTISGTTTPTGVLTLNEGTATGNPAPNGSIQWYIGGAAISGQTGLTIDKAVHGVGVYHAVVTWANGIAPNAARTSNAITVAAATTAPAFTTEPTLTGDPIVGETLTATPGTYTGNPAPTIAYSWHRRVGAGPWVEIAGESSATYVLAAGDEGYNIQAQLRLTNSAGSTAWTSATPTSGLGPVTAGAAVPIAGTLTNPPLSMQLGTIGDQSSRPFLNAFKQATQWNNIGSQAEGIANGYINEHGQILAIPPAGNIWTQCLLSAPAESGATGRWRFRWTGDAQVQIYGMSNLDTSTPGEVWGDFTANGSNYATILFDSVGAGVVPLGNFSLVHEDDIADFDAGGIFRQQFLDDLRNYRCIRFAPWTTILEAGDINQPAGATHGLSVHNWASRPKTADEIFHWRGVPYEWCAELCNLIGADGWFCMPTAATVDHFEGAAALLQSLMPAPRHVYAEYSTKTWDFAGSPQAHYCSQQGGIAFAPDGDASSYRHWYGMRSTIMGQAFRSVWGADPRLHIVMQHQADEAAGAHVDIFEASQWQAKSGINGNPAYVAPHTVADVMTVHGQIDGGMAYGNASAVIDNWRTTLTETEAFNRMRDQMLDPEGAMESHAGNPENPTGGHFIQLGGQDVERAVTYMNDKWAYFRTAANGYGLQLACYEAGSHLNNTGADLAFMAAFSASSQMGQVYTAIFNALRTAGFDGPICASSHVRTPDANAVGGISRWLGDHNPGWQAWGTINDANDGPAGRGALDFVGDDERTGAPPVTTAPTITSADAWPQPGSVLTITAGSADTTVTLDGATVATVLAGQTLNYTATAAGTLTATGDGSASVVIEPAQSAVTQIGVSRNSVYTGTETAVTGVTNEGTFGLSWIVNGSGAEVQKVADGFQFGAGKYLQLSSGFPAGNYSGFGMVVQVVSTGIPAASATPLQISTTAGSRGLITQSASTGAWSASMTTTPSTIQYLLPSDSVTGTVLTFGLEWDYNGGSGRYRMIGVDGYRGDWLPASSSVLLALSQLRIGQNYVGRVLSARFTLRPNGGAFPIEPLKLWERVANKRVEDRAALDTGPVQIIDGGGQSLWLGYQTASPQREHINLIDRAGVRIPAGLVDTTGAGVITSQGPTNSDINQSIPATGTMPAAVFTFGPVQHYMLVALRKRRALLGLPNPQLVSLGHGISGQSIDEFDDDTPVTGALGLRIQNNRQYMTQQAWAITAGRTRSYPYSLWVQGEADANDTPGTYYPALMELLDNWGDHVFATTGQRPTPIVTQIGTYINQPGHNYAVRREQVQACLDSGGIFGAPWYQYPVVDNTIHPGVTETMLMGDTLAWAITEFEQGNGWPALIPTATRNGADLVLTYPEPVTLHDAAKYTPYGGVADAGFHGAGTISGVSASGSTIRLTTAATSWRYAEQNYDATAQQSGGLNYGPSRGLVRSTRTTPSVLVPGQTLYRFAPAWSGAV